jgi:V8-like Glu-specific endopeptidase
MITRWRGAAVGTALAAVLLAGCGSGKTTTTKAGVTASLPSTWSRERMQKRIQHLQTATVTPSSRPARVYIREGALFYNDASGDHFCTASVVESPKMNLLITAAHCIHTGRGGSYRKNMVFAPQYLDGSTPDGIWTVSSELVGDTWIKSSDPDMDVGFMTVAAQNGKNISEVLGANDLGINPGYTNIVRVVGYPSNGNAPITCVNKTTKQSDTQVRFACQGYFNGTSGSPWLTHPDPKSRTATIVGVVGGYQAGGSTDYVSYSPYFGDAVKALYTKAQSLS